MSTIKIKLYFFLKYKKELPLSKYRITKLNYNSLKKKPLEALDSST